MTDTHEEEDLELHKRISAVRDAGQPWFHVELAIPYDVDTESEAVKQLLTSLEQILTLAIENLDSQINTPAVIGPRIIIPGAH